MKTIRIRNYIINTPIEDILYDIRDTLDNGKLKDIKVSMDDITVTCPNSDHAGGCEEHPDCHINISDEKQHVNYGSFHCFACDVKGNFVKFVALCFESTISYAERWLISNYGEDTGINYEIADKIVFNKTKLKTKSYLDATVLEQYSSWCPYLAERKLTVETCKKFNVKYDPVNRQIVFPCYDENNNLLMIPRRSIDNKVFYLDKNVEKPLYCLDNIIKNHYKKAIITEGPFDCLLGNQYGFPTIATFGNISDYQISKLNSSGINVLYTMFDNDDAGKEFAKKIKNSVSKYIIVENIPIPNGHKDIGELSYDEFWKIINKYVN